MIKNGITFSIEECEMLLELLGWKTKEDYKSMSSKQLSLITELRSILRYDPIEDHIKHYHD